MLKTVLFSGHSPKIHNLLTALHFTRLKKQFLLIFILMAGSLSFAQGPSGDFWPNVRYGGGIGLGFGNNTFSIAVAPSAIYQVTPKFAAGLGLNFNYSEINESRFTAIGGSLMTFFNPIPAIHNPPRSRGPLPP